MILSSLRIAGSADVPRAALDARVSCTEAGLSASDAERVTTGVSELASNIAKYAGSGRVTLRLVDVDGRRAIDIEARDRGPGIASIEDAMIDHRSTGGSLGLGLPGTRRLMDSFDIESRPGEGTTVRARKWIA